MSKKTLPHGTIQNHMFRLAQTRSGISRYHQQFFRLDAQQYDQKSLRSLVLRHKLDIP
jgi:hypothetical protein